MTTLPLRDPTRLLADLDFVRSLARQLCRDEHTAEDVAQQTMTAALERPPQRLSNWRGWLSVATRNFARKHARGERRRQAREQLAAEQRDAPLPSAAEVVEREQLRGRVVQAVLDLPDPYRTVLLLRHYRGYDVPRCAQELQVPESTVRTQLSRGLQKLRERLDAEHDGDRSRWLAGLLPFAAPDAATKAASFGIVGVFGWLAAAALLVGAIVWAIPPQSTPPPQVGAAPLATDPGDAPDGPTVATAALGSFRAQDAAPASERVPHLDPARDWLQHGMVRYPDPNQAFAWIQVANAELEFFVSDTQEPTTDARSVGKARSDEHGQFSVDLSALLPMQEEQARATWLFCTVDADGYAPLIDAARPISYLRRARTPWDVHVTPRIGIVGRVVGPDKRPLANARVYRVLDGSRNGAQTDLFGRYSIPPQPNDPPGAKMFVFATHASFGISDLRHLRLDGKRDTKVRDLRVRHPLATIEGVALDADGRPAPHLTLHARFVENLRGRDADQIVRGELVRAFWWQNRMEVTTDAHGRFAFRSLRPDTDYYISSTDLEYRSKLTASRTPTPTHLKPTH